MNQTLYSGTYPMQTGNWYFFAIVLDGILNKGSLQIDYSYGYNNGTTDFKVSTLCKARYIEVKGKYYLLFNYCLCLVLQN